MASAGNGTSTRAVDAADDGGSMALARQLAEQEFLQGLIDPPIATSSVDAIALRPGVAGNRVEDFIGRGPSADGTGKMATADKYGTRIAIPIDERAAAAITAGKLAAITGLADGAPYLYSVQDIGGVTALVVEGPAFADFSIALTINLQWTACDPSQLVVNVEGAERDDAGMRAVESQVALTNMRQDLEKFEGALEEHARRSTAVQDGSKNLGDLPNEALLQEEARMLRELAFGEVSNVDAYQGRLQEVHHEMERRANEPGGLAYAPEVQALVDNYRQLIEHHEQVIAKALEPFGAPWQPAAETESDTEPDQHALLQAWQPKPLVTDIVTEPIVPRLPGGNTVSSARPPRKPSARDSARQRHKKRTPPLWLKRLKANMKRRQKMRKSRRGICPF